jgi:hypothetical protein
VTVEVVTRSYRTVRGRSVCVAILDELAFWRDDNSANPDTEVLNAIRASMATFGSDAMVIAGSSPYSRRGVLWDAWHEHFGKPGGKNLVWQAATRTMNPSVPQSFIDAEIERDPASAEAEYYAQFRSDIEAFLTREAVEACVSPGVLERQPISSVAYFGFVDPSGGSADSMTLAVAHVEDSVVILDAIRERKPPFSPDAVVTEFAELLRSYGIGTVKGDRYGGEWPREAFRKQSIDYICADKVRSELYLAMLPLINSRRAELLDDKRLINQLVSLERRTARSGKDSVDHAPGAHDDVANAVAGALVSAQFQPQQIPIVTPFVVGQPRLNPFASGDDRQASAYFDQRNSGFTIR